MASLESEAARIFLETVEAHERDQWAEFVRAATAGNPVLLERVDALLKAHDESNPMLDAERHLATADIPTPSERPGTLIGPYKLLEQIGEGGFGVVFMAEQQEPVRRKVALKVIKPGMETRQVIARFEAERQALALMDHPNIARILDAGTTGQRRQETGDWKQEAGASKHGAGDSILSPDSCLLSPDLGRPYFVMELVRGVPITDYCDENRLSPRQRLEMFVSVCQAVQHAHQKGIIHRDLKPTNVLVTLHDGTPVVKVIDFGIAKALGRPLTDKTLVTGFAQMIGTPLYISPEQAELSGLDMDTRSDIYSLGVVLYELLTGTTPFEKERLHAADYDEMRRIIREEEPARPSARISTLGQAAATVSSNRQSDPQRLGNVVRGELDWIVMRCLEKDRNRRYATAIGLANDIIRFLNDEPVDACPPSPAYRLRKFVRRHRAATLLAAGAAVLLLVAVGAMTVGMVVIRGEQQETKKALHAASLANQELQESLEREQKSLNTMRLALARQHWLTGEMDRARQYLEECPISLRDRNWRILRRAYFAELLRLETPRLATKVCFSPDGSRLAALVNEGLTWNHPSKAGLWHADTGELISYLPEHRLPLVDIVFTSDGTTVITVGRQLASIPGNGEKRTLEDAIEIHHWDSSTGQSTGVALRHLKASRSLFLSPDGRQLAIRGLDADVWIIDAHSAAYVSGFKAASTAVTWALPWSLDGRFVAAAGAGYWIVYDPKTQSAARGPATSAGPVRLALSPDGRRLAVANMARAGATGIVKIWDVASNQELQTLEPPNTTLRDLIFSPDGRLLALAHDYTIGVWDLQTNHEIFNFRGHSKMINHLAFRPDGRRLASAGSDGTVRIWDTSPLEDEPEPPGAGRK